MKRIIVLADLDPDMCSDVCPSGALEVGGGTVTVKPELCLACLACMALCGPDRVRVVVDWVCEE